MRDPKRIQRIISKLQTEWERYPDVRLIQLIINIANHSDDEEASLGETQLFYLEDRDIEKRIDSYCQMFNVISDDIDIAEGEFLDQLRTDKKQINRNTWKKDVDGSDIVEGDLVHIKYADGHKSIPTSKEGVVKWDDSDCGFYIEIENKERIRFSFCYYIKKKDPLVGVVDIEELDDGGANITFSMSQDSSDMFAGIGIVKVIEDAMNKEKSNGQ